jgi:hypothetical protein
MDIGQKMQGCLNINVQTWANYVLTEFAGFDEATVAKLLAPTTGTANVQFTPMGRTINFERLSKEQKDTIAKAFQDNPELQEAVNSLVYHDAYVTDTSNTCSSTKVSVATPPVGTVTNSSSIQEAVSRDASSRKAVEEEVRERARRLQEELKSIVNKAQKGE